MFIAATPFQPLCYVWLGLSLVCLSACSPSNQTPPVTPTTAPTQQPQSASTPIHADQSPQNIKVVLSWDTIAPQEMTATVTGRITQVLAQEGQFVQAGQRLLQIQTDIQAQHATTITQAPNAQAKQQAYKKWQQDLALHAQGFISQAAVAKSEAAYRAASQSQTVVKPAAPTAQTPTLTWLQAPFNGVIKPLAVSHGNHVKNGQKLFVIEPTDVKRIKILVAQENHQALFVGQRLFVNMPAPSHGLWLQISELPPLEDKQYVLAYAVWPQDLPKPEQLEPYPAHLLLNPTPQL